ncbi:MAG TPA: SDR family NAD(P)-dependent oxidoreductase [Lactobacillaceae bacterium]|jgi:NADP-dependent 3-hydroxy acid dehydrogenase YdfG
MTTAFITGATSGIGVATARLFAAYNIDLVITGRRTERLLALQAELTNVRVTPLAFDVSDRQAVFEAVASLPADVLADLSILVNNAGNAYGLASFQTADLDDFDQMIDINVKGLLYVTKAVLPHLTNKPNAQIVNLGSIAGKQVYPNGNVYNASKFAVDALSQAMRLDLLPLGIKVVNIAPGAVETEFSLVRFNGDQAAADAVYAGYEPLVASDIADAIYYAVSRPEHVQVADMVIFPKNQASARDFQRD